MPGKDGKGPPEHFTRKEEYILVNGMIQFHVDDDESAIRSKIVSVISTTKDPVLISKSHYLMSFLKVYRCLKLKH